MATLTQYVAHTLHVLPFQHQDHARHWVHFAVLTPVVVGNSAPGCRRCLDALPLPVSCACSVCWRAQDLLLSPGSHLTPLRVVSGTHLDINLTLLPPVPPAAAATAAAAEASDPAATTPQPQSEGCLEAGGSRCGSGSSGSSGSDGSDGSSAGLVFKSWKPDGKGAAVLSFNWESGVLMFDFDEPFPDAYNPHPDDTPERRRVGGQLKHYTPGEGGSCSSNS